MEGCSVAQTEEMSRIQEQKHVRADRTIKRHKLRKANDAMKEMLRVLKALRIK